MIAGSGAPDRSQLSKPEIVLLLAIVLVAAALRLPALATSPPGPYSDEAAIATTAASLAATGRDLSGRFLPFYAEQQAFARWGEPHIITQPVYQYFSVPFVEWGGLELRSLRLASALLGILTIPAVFLLAGALFDRRVALAAAAALAVSPWHLHFSRIGFEAIALPLLLALSSWLLHRGLTRPGHALAGSFGMALATYAYPAALVFVPLLLVCFVTAQRRAIFAQRRLLVACVLALLLFEIPNLASLPQRGRAEQLSIASADLASERTVAALEDCASPLAQTVLANRALLVPAVFLHAYASHFGPSFLFTRGDANPRHGATGYGVAFWFAAPLLILGLIALLRRAREPGSQFALGWLLVAPVASSLTTGSPHAIRAICMLPMLDIVAGLGAISLWTAARDASSGWNAKRVAATSVAILLGLSAPVEIARYLHHYHGNYRRDAAPHFQDGALRAIRAAQRRRAGYERILVSPTIFDAYSFILMSGAIDYEKLDPTRGLNERLEPFGYRILFPDDPTDLGARRDLVVLSHRDDVAELEHRVLAEFPFPDGSPNLLLIEIGPER